MCHRGTDALLGRLYLHANNVEVNLACLLIGYFSYLAYLAMRRGDDGIGSMEVFTTTIATVLAAIVPVILRFIIGFPPDSPMIPGWWRRLPDRSTE